jgi:hypothetical protein
MHYHRQTTLSSHSLKSLPWQDIKRHLYWYYFCIWGTKKEWYHGGRGEEKDKEKEDDKEEENETIDDVDDGLCYIIRILCLLRYHLKEVDRSRYIEVTDRVFIVLSGESRFPWEQQKLIRLSGPLQGLSAFCKGFKPYSATAVNIMAGKTSPLILRAYFV